MTAEGSEGPARCVCVCVCVLLMRNVHICIGVQLSCLEVFSKEGDASISDGVVADIQVSHVRVGGQCFGQYLNILQ